MESRDSHGAASSESDDDDELEAFLANFGSGAAAAAVRQEAEPRQEAADSSVFAMPRSLGRGGYATTSCETTAPGRKSIKNGQSEVVRSQGITMAVAGKELLSGAELHLHQGCCYGMLGNNGCGKSSLLKDVANGMLPGFPSRLRTLLVEQELSGGDQTVLQEVLTLDKAKASLRREADEIEERLCKEKLSEKEAADLTAELTSVMDQLNLDDDHAAEQRALQILQDFGFTEHLVRVSTKSLSGGWRMRLALAKAFFYRPDVLLLDEPTNHLDLEAVSWLEDQLLRLRGYESVVVIVSHDRAFLDVVATDIIEFTGQKLVLWAMDFQTYIVSKHNESVNYESQAEQLENKRAQAMETASRLERATRGKKGDQKKSGQVAQKRLKAKQMGFEKTSEGTRWKVSTMGHREFSLMHVYGQRINQFSLEKVALAAASVFQHTGGQTPFRVRFLDPSPLGDGSTPLLTLQNVEFYYASTESTVLSGVNLTAHWGQRIALLGPNGHGKSTLMDLMRGILEPTAGQVTIRPGLNVAHYAQHSASSLPQDVSALAYLQELFPSAKEMELRNLLGSYNLRGHLATTPIGKLSGGQKARVSFAAVTHSRPHALLLDEPTNHLDMATIGYLGEALSSFKGLVVLISHNRDLVTAFGHNVELWDVSSGRVRRFHGTLEDFKSAARKQFAGGRTAARGLEITPLLERRGLNSAGFNNEL
eukprot:TRINITY_DN80622_c0_g1_i1.p1 TRINITY_DN80622_c0_g1~~TRINITY_DN80622_c0_g1_i1.p1  ORF type:complete len:706 (-),score=158.54 TRINITY_DN80622_c0_g1_i1:113-2230(-)